MRSLVDSFDRYPFLRITLGWVAGSAASFLLPVSFPAGWLWAAVALFLFILLPVASRSLSRRWADGTGWGLAGLLMLTGAAWTQTDRWQPTVEWPMEACAYRAVVDGRVQGGGSRSVGWSAYLVDDGQRFVGKRVRVTALKNDSTERLKVGDGVWLYGEVEPLRNNGNPGEPDFAGMMRRNGWEGRMFLKPGCWRRMAAEPTLLLHDLPLWERMRIASARWREKLIARYGAAGVNGDELAVLTALTLGDKGLLRDELRERYARTGTSHVLALSGLHLSILYFFLFLLLSGGVRLPGFRVVREVVLLGFVWLFVWLAGAPLSLVRAAVMCSLLSAGRLVWERMPAVNNLALAALGIVMVKPSALFDIGFQLSFLAVIFILAGVPLFMRLWSPRHRVLRWGWNLVAVSCCAQLGTAPLVGLYFHQLPVWFLAANFVVIPLVTCLLGGAVLFFLLGWIGPVGICLGKGLSVGVACMNQALSSLSNWPYSYVDVYPSVWTVVGMYVVLLFAYVAFRYRLYGARIALWVAMAAVAVSICWPWKPSYGTWFYHLPGCPAIHFVSPTVNRIWTERPERLERATALLDRNFWRRNGWERPEIAEQGDSVRGFWIKHGLVGFGQHVGMLLTKGDWTGMPVGSPLKVDFLYVGARFRGETDRLAVYFKPRVIVLDASLSREKRMEWREICRRHGYVIHDLASSGAFHLTY